MHSLKSIFWRVRSQTWDRLKQPVLFVVGRMGYHLLSKKKTLAYLEPAKRASYAGRHWVLPGVVDAVEPSKVIFQETTIHTASSYVWRYESNGKPTVLLRCGLLLTDHNVLNTDYWNDDALREIFRPKPRTKLKTHVLLAPIGHPFDGDKFVGYYDFIFLIATKLCRIKEVATEAEFQTAIVSYPLVDTAYEHELLGLLGFGPERIFDCRLTEIQPTITYLGNHDNWMHQNLADIMLLKKHLTPLIQSPRSGQNRIYISRAGRRRVVNEGDLIQMLKKYGFIIVDDTPRSLTEQYAIYHNASFIMGPHGASFTNLLWCEPGTHLFELFTARFAQTHFQYLANVLDLTYSAYCQDPAPLLDYGAIADDIAVSVPDLEQYLDAFFGQK